jgi:rfaE bifunctional protein nucleotidyltransferase chain/domain
MTGNGSVDGEASVRSERIESDPKDSERTDARFRPALKILTRDELLERLGRPRTSRVVFTNGCFDLLHRGHVEYLNAARTLGDVLVVGLNSDESVRRLKGPTRPVNSEEDRAVILAALAAVDAVTVFAEDTPRELIAALLPDVLVKGGDYTVDTIVGAREVAEAGGEVLALPLVPGRSTTSILERYRQGCEP